MIPVFDFCAVYDGVGASENNESELEVHMKTEFISGMALKSKSICNSCRIKQRRF